MELPTQFKFPQINGEKKLVNYYKKCGQYLKKYFGPNAPILYKKFIILMKNAISEERNNAALDKIQNKCKIDNLRISHLTELDGNCMFESIIKTGACGDISIAELRSGIAFIMTIYKDTKNFFPNQESSMSELFDLLNTGDGEVNNVIKSDDNSIVKYTYDIMCKDLCVITSWYRLQTHLILMVVSFLYKLKICIINDEESELKYIINVWENSIIPENEIRTIYLGHITECHYVPICENNNDNLEIEPIMHYTGEMKKLEDFIKGIEESLYNTIKMYHPHLLNQN